MIHRIVKRLTRMVSKASPADDVPPPWPHTICEVTVMDTDRLRRFAESLKALTRIESSDPLHGAAPASASAVLGELRLLIPLEGLIDLDAERARLAKEVARVASEKEKSEAKLAKFGDKVPANVVDQERQRLTDWTVQLASLLDQQTRLG